MALITMRVGSLFAWLAKPLPGLGGASVASGVLRVDFAKDDDGDGFTGVVGSLLTGVATDGIPARAACMLGCDGERRVVVARIEPCQGERQRHGETKRSVSAPARAQRDREKR